MGLLDRLRRKSEAPRPTEPQEGFEVDKMDSHKAMFEYCMSGDLEGIKKLVAHDPALVDAQQVVYTSQGDYRRTPLAVATKYGRANVVSWLISQGADVNATDSTEEDLKQDQYSPLHMVDLGYNGDEYPDKNEYRRDDSDADLQADYLEVTRLLVAGGANVNARDSMGRTPLHVAAEGSPVKVVALLLDSGADVAARNEFGQTALHAAAMYGSTAVLELLLDRGADPNAADEEGWTPLEAATGNSQQENAALLKSRGATE